MNKSQYLDQEKIKMNEIEIERNRRRERTMKICMAEIGERRGKKMWNMKELTGNKGEWKNWIGLLRPRSTLRIIH